MQIQQEAHPIRVHGSISCPSKHQHAIVTRKLQVVVVELNLHVEVCHERRFGEQRAAREFTKRGHPVA
jgi:hypothetical protein